MIRVTTKYLPIFLIVMVTGCLASHNPKLPDVPTTVKGNYILEIAVSDENWQAVKYTEKTGETWILYDNSWKKIQDAGNLPESRYSIRVIATSTMNWQAIRLDTVSGRSWMIHAFKWIEIK